MPSILITGASRGFGRALADEYIERGWTIFPLLRSREMASEISRTAGYRCFPIIGDVTSADIEEKIVSVLGKHTEALDVLINNAGNIKKARGFEGANPEDMEEHFKVHCIGAFRCVRASIEFLKKSVKPVIVNISSRRGSISGTVTGELPRIYAYNIAKAAQNMLTACLSVDLRQYGIKVFAVHPGRLKTEVAPADADVEPRAAAAKLADWIDRTDENTPVGLNNLIEGGLIEW